MHHSGCNVALKDGLSFPKLVPDFPITNPSISIQALLPCKINFVLQIKGATQVAYRKRFL